MRQLQIIIRIELRSCGFVVLQVGELGHSIGGFPLMHDNIV